MLRGLGWLPGAGLDVAVNMHKILRHDSKPGIDLVRTKDKGRTGYYERYVTAQSVTKGMRLTLGVLHMPALESIADFVRKIVDSCLDSGAAVNTVMLDREFFNAGAMAGRVPRAI